VKNLFGEASPLEKQHQHWKAFVTAAAEQDDYLLWQCAALILTAWTKERQATQMAQAIEETEGPPSFLLCRLSLCQQTILGALEFWEELRVHLLVQQDLPDPILWPGAPAQVVQQILEACQRNITRCRQWASRVQTAFLEQAQGRRVLLRLDPLSLQEEEA
jgi:hypothetical protein